METKNENCVYNVVIAATAMLAVATVTTKANIHTRTTWQFDYSNSDSGSTFLFDTFFCFFFSLECVVFSFSSQRRLIVVSHICDGFFFGVLSRIHKLNVKKKKTKFEGILLEIILNNILFFYYLWPFFKTNSILCALCVCLCVCVGVCCTTLVWLSLHMHADADRIKSRDKFDTKFS